MLFNFQGPNLLRCIEVFHRNSLFIIACRFEFVKLFFQDFLNRFGSASRNFLTGSPFGCLSDRSGVPLSDSSIIIPRQLLFVNTFFALFLTFFEKSCFFPFSSLFPAILRPPIPTLPPLYFFAPFCYNV